MITRHTNNQPQIRHRIYCSLIPSFFLIFFSSSLKQHYISPPLLSLFSINLSSCNSPSLSPVTVVSSAIALLISPATILPLPLVVLSQWSKWRRRKDLNVLFSRFEMDCTSTTTVARSGGDWWWRRWLCEQRFRWWEGQWCCWMLRQTLRERRTIN